MSANKKRSLFWLIGICLILAVPFVAMQFTHEVNWKLSDFIIFGALLASVGLLYELIIRKQNNATKRIGFTIILISIFLLIWAELAVGVFTDLF